MGEEPVSYGIDTGNRFALVDIGDEIEDPEEFYKLIEQSKVAKKAEQKKKKEKKPEKKKEEEKPEKKEDESAKENRGRGRGRGRGSTRGRDGGDRGGDRGGYNRDREGGDRSNRSNRYNRDNDDSRPPRLQDDNFEKGADEGEKRGSSNYRGNRDRGNNRGRGRGGYRGTGRTFDRHSGNDRNGQKGHEKREGGGAHNWGSPTEEPAAEPNWSAEPAADGWAAAETGAADAGGWGAAEPSGFDNVEPAGSGFDNVQQPSGFDNVESSGFDNVEGPSAEKSAEAAAKAAEEEAEANQMTLEEYQAKLAAERKGPTFTIRKAGENEDGTQWKNFAPLKKEAEDGYMGGMDEYEKVIIRGGRKKNLVEMDVKFTKPSRRGGRGRDDHGGERRERTDRGGDRERGGQRRGGAPSSSNFSDADFPSLS